MPPRSSQETSPIHVMRWNDESSTQDNTETKPALTMKGGKNGKRPSQLTKGVRFANENEVVEIPHINKMSDEMIANIWYHSKEYADIKSGYQVTIFMMEAGEKLPVEEHSSRGLEYRTQEGAWARYENKRDAYNAVLDEQDEQWKKDADDHDAIARVYLEQSSKCLKAAQSRGKKDSSDVQEYMASPTDAPKIKKKKKKKEGSSSKKDGEKGEGEDHEKKVKKKSKDSKHKSKTSV